jgi:hypothetical protein
MNQPFAFSSPPGSSFESLKNSPCVSGVRRTFAGVSRTSLADGLPCEWIAGFAPVQSATPIPCRSYMSRGPSAEQLVTSDRPARSPLPDSACGRERV